MAYPPDPIVIAERIALTVIARSRTFVEAIQFTGTGENCSAVTEFLGGVHDTRHGWNTATNTGGMVNTLRGVEEFTPGDWIVREPNTFAVYAPWIFEELFEVDTAAKNLCGKCSHPGYDHPLGERCLSPGCRCSRFSSTTTSSARLPSPSPESSRPVSTDEEEGEGLEDGGLQGRPSGGAS